VLFLQHGADEQTQQLSVTTRVVYFVIGFVAALCIGKPQLEILMLSNNKGFEADFTARKNEKNVYTNE
jgi:hypothetical protein